VSNALPLEVFDRHAAIIGQSGSGKSFLARLVVEYWLRQGLRVCIVDPTDVWWGLRSDASGKKPGFPVAIFGGGPHADVGIGDRSGERIAQLIAERNLPAVISTVEMGSAEQQRFMTDFLGTLYRRNSTAMQLVLDEADELAPQMPLPEQRRMLGAVDKIARRGRVRGFRVLMITQRTASLHNNILAQARTMVAMQLALPADIEAFERWIKRQASIEQAKEILDSLPGLAQGEGWVWAPDRGLMLRDRFPPIATYDSMRTPEHGDAPLPPPSRLAPVELGELRALLDTGEPEVTPPSAGKKSSKGTVGEVLPAPPDPAAIAAADKRGYERAQAELQPAIEQLRELVGRGHAAAIAVKAVIDNYFAENPVEAVGTLDRQLPAATRPAAQPSPAVRPQRRRAAQAKADIEISRPDPAPAGDITLSPAAERMLKALASFRRSLTWQQLATQAGIKYNAGVFNVGRSQLRRAGAVEESEGAVTVTKAGRDRAGDVPEPPRTMEDVVARWVDKLPTASARMLLALVKPKEPRWIAKEVLAADLGLTLGAGVWNVALATLRRNGLADVETDRVRPSADLWTVSP
jgi:uncharacterized protein DUF87